MGADGSFEAAAPGRGPCPGSDVDLRRIDAHPDHWYPLAWSDELKPNRPLGRRYAGEPVVLFRNAAGRLFALEDRCAHRQVPLSMGVVDGDRLKCGYHGWAYDGGSGRCVDVPYLGSKTLPNGVRTYPVCEVDGLVFIYPGDPAFAEARRPQALAGRADAKYKTRRLDRTLKCHYSFAHENLFDMNHQFLHRKQMGLIKAKLTGRRQGDDWCEVDYTFVRAAGRGTLGEKAIVGLIGKSFSEGGELMAGGDGMTIRTEYPHQRLRVFVGGEAALDVWLGYTPLDAAQRSNRTFGYLSVRRPPVPLVLDALWPFVTWFTENIFQEDQEIMELEQAAHDAQGADWNNEVFPAIRDLRALLARNGAPSRLAPATLDAVEAIAAE